MAKMTVARAMVEVLKSEGVEIIFGIPGAAIYPFYDALYDSDIKHVLVRTEQAAVHEASGYARTTGKVGVCVATSGPGATNLITGIATAYMDSVPIVAITGQVNSSLIGKDVFQEVDITGATAPFTKHNYLVKDPKKIVRILKEAFYIASTGRRGPVLIDVPIDVQLQEIEFEIPKEIDIPGYKPKEKGHPLQIKRAVEAIENSQRPVVCSGGGVIASGASQELQILIEKQKIPVISTLMGIGSIPTDHPYYLGMIGSHGQKEANLALRQADLLIVIGARLADRALGDTKITDNMKIIHIDIDPAEIGKNVDTNVPIVGDAKQVLSEINKRISERKDFWAHDIKAHKKVLIDDDKLHPYDVLREISRAYNGDYIITTDVGQHQIWAAHNLYIKEPGTFITSGGLGTMGYGVPAAIGAKFGRPDKEVISITGDGSFQMLLQELATIKREQVPIKIVLFNNTRLGMVYELQKKRCTGRFIATCLDGNPDFMILAKAYGIESMRLENKEKLKEAIEIMKSHKGPFLLEVVTSPDEPTIS
ncbi:biosynthetic-type acetolactate synthase large subunit [Caldicellulosiruptor acetigenus]|uniref:Acetolactate synthase n=1 Tax=Caldicellulosiruptor acetigenus 6A TaxID=632516 RepID=G2PX69_9FIRM|nr:biosynthetic-type acetolactate synthase large subunit [Caldicellulosiruptor acetigenus]AEM73848.1 acetolactate synthase, large subunit, biosynthetic type [Caldicellulosiruptor acetigenus 6A]